MDTLLLAVIAPNGRIKALLAEALRDLPVRVVFERWMPVDWAEFLDRLARLNVGAVLVDYDRFEEDFPELAARVKTIRPPAPAVVAVCSRVSPDVEHQARMGGADRILSMPFDRTLRPLLEELEAQRLVDKAVVDTPGRLLGLTGAEGGCGTTTMACLLALALRRVTRQPVLLADLDAGVGLVGFLTGARTAYSLLDAAASLHRLDADYWKTLAATHHSGIDVIPGPADPALMRGADPARLRRVLRFLRTCYSWLVADLGEIWDGTWLDLRDEFDQLWVVATPTAAGLYRARRSLEKLRAAGIEPDEWRLLINHAGRLPLTDGDLESLVGKRPDAWLPECSKLREGVGSGGPLELRGKAAGTMLRLAACLAGVAQAKAPAPPHTSRLRVFRREGFPRLIPRL